MGTYYSPLHTICWLNLKFRDTLTVSAWRLLELTKDISRARTHFLILTLRRTASSNPRALYSLVDAEVLPWSVLEAAYANRVNVSDLSPLSPKLMLEKDEEERKRDGGLGSVMVISLELPKGDNRPPHNALTEVSSHICNFSWKFLTVKAEFLLS